MANKLSLREFSQVSNALENGGFSISDKCNWHANK